ncbi:hypothetical protein CLOSTMETH_03119 [[Clostridium] methylpentosum DSM 5476]|uniref:Uncharacterized protein n=1 Tax=[Clostridium] methylpentosum DSM 5476 TaxID=537013 RepID=C0EGX4_9FIRM|nr:hypothetical protein CLOSTMETH_03119 [[Clostridium] methylpentosum DSM 5476]
MYTAGNSVKIAESLNETAWGRSLKMRQQKEKELLLQREPVSFSAPCVGRPANPFRAGLNGSSKTMDQQ